MNKYSSLFLWFGGLVRLVGLLSLEQAEGTILMPLHGPALLTPPVSKLSNIDLKYPLIIDMIIAWSKVQPADAVALRSEFIPPPLLPLTCEEREARLCWLKAFFMADTATPA